MKWRAKGENQKVSFLKYLTPPDFCLFDVRRRVEKDIFHWLKNGGVLKGSGRGGLNRVSMQALRAKLVEMCTGAIKR
jgi:hypothetical protein